MLYKITSIFYICLLFSMPVFSQEHMGLDSRLFVDPYLYDFLKQAKDQRVLDAGSGAGIWAVQGAKQGAAVWGIDTQANLVERANDAAMLAQVVDQTDFVVGDLATFPYKEAFFHKAMSINVADSLPSTTVIPLPDGTYKIMGLGPYFTELAKSLSVGGKVIFTAPASFDVIFTTGKKSYPESVTLIKQKLAHINPTDNAQQLTLELSEFHDINRATFAIRNNQLKLITHEKELLQGEKIWYKVFNTVTLKYYHPQQEYIVEALKAGFKVTAIHYAKFKDETSRLHYNRTHGPSHQLGKEYISHHPFIVLEFEKI